MCQGKQIVCGTNTGVPHEYGGLAVTSPNLSCAGHKKAEARNQQRFRAPALNFSLSAQRNLEITFRLSFSVRDASAASALGGATPSMSVPFHIFAVEENIGTRVQVEHLLA